MEARLPVSMMVSFALHGGALGGYLYLNQVSKASPMRMISNVDIIVRARAPLAPVQNQPAARKPSPPSTWNFLKMALPAIPKAEVPLEVKREEAKKALIDVPDKLGEDKGRLKKQAQLDALDLGKRRQELAALDVSKQLASRQARAALAEAPKLEEVGTRRASQKAMRLDALAEEARGRLEPQDLRALDAPLPKRDLRAAAAALLPEESAPAAKRSVLGKMADMLTSASAPAPLDSRPIDAPQPRKRAELKVAGLPKKEEVALAGEKKKSVEIEGPLADRKVVSYEVPPFPDWASAQGIIEAQVRIRFYVGASGEVLPEMRVENTSGYGALDRLAMDSLKRWRFEALAASAGRQWGVITFRFLLE